MAVPAARRLGHEAIVRGIKLLDIGFVTFIYFALGFLAALAIDRALGPFDRRAADAQPTARIVLNASLHMWALGVLFYVARNLVEVIPFPLDGVHGFSHRLVKELGTAPVFVYVVFFYSYNLQSRLYYLYYRVTGRRPPIAALVATQQPQAQHAAAADPALAAAAESKRQ
jgi:hypothetical protein